MNSRCPLNQSNNKGEGAGVMCKGNNNSNSEMLNYPLSLCKRFKDPLLVLLDWLYKTTTELNKATNYQKGDPEMLGFFCKIFILTCISSLVLSLSVPLSSQSSSDGALSHPGLQEALVDGSDCSYWKPAVFGRFAGLGLAADHAANGRFLLPPVLR